jgi:catechol-2,3-dioxygenase
MEYEAVPHVRSAPRRRARYSSMGTFHEIRDFPRILVGMNLKAIDHVAVSVKSLEDSFRWYSQVLGFQLFHKFTRTWMIEKYGMKIGLMRRPDAKPVEDLDNQIAIQHFAFGVVERDFQPTVDTLTTLGIPFEGPEDTGIAFSIFLTDPDGHTIEITTYHKPIPAPDVS